MRECAVIGCQSRVLSRSANVSAEKCHFFRVPQGKFEVWSVALERKHDETFSTKSIVCQKHFRPEDISWPKPVPEGGTARNRGPRLKAGVVPTVFSWNPAPEASEDPTTSQNFETPPVSPEDTPKADAHFSWEPISLSHQEIANELTLDPSGQMTLKPCTTPVKANDSTRADRTWEFMSPSLVPQTSLSSELFGCASAASLDISSAIGNIECRDSQDDGTAWGQIPPLTQHQTSQTCNILTPTTSTSMSPSISPPDFDRSASPAQTDEHPIIAQNVTAASPPVSFAELCNANFVMPLDWVKQQRCCEKIRFLHFFVTKCFMTRDKMRSFISVELIVKEDMAVVVNIFGQSPLRDTFPFDMTPITTVEQLQQLILGLGSLKLCPGSEAQDELDRVGCVVAYKDIADVWRHKSCSLFLAFDSMRPSCMYCMRLKRSVQMRVRRTMNDGEAKRIRIVGSGENKPPTVKPLLRIREIQTITHRVRIVASKDAAK